MPGKHDDHPANLLADERSPYLRQHAHNPVMWRPWSDEAFVLARTEDKPVLVSIGYATCHWCHVMAHESFEDDDVAEYLNDHYICIKVDREERPDIDAIYMDVCQGMTGHGGWPLTIITDGNRRPFFAGTYFPRTSRGNRIGFLDLMQRVRDVWDTDRARLEESATQITDALAAQAMADLHGDIPVDVFDVVAEHHRRTFDDVHGGFNAQPKFPSPHHLLLLLRIARRQGAEDLLPLVTTTLDAMRAGGMYDHVGFGFHRYSTDREWLVPHFEKMLYDQAMLMMAYTEAWQVTGDAAYRTVVLEIASYVQRSLTSVTGGFMSAQDADSEGVEGKCYVWSHDAFVPIAGERYAAAFNIRPDGNFHDEATGDASLENIPHVDRAGLRDIMLDATWNETRERLLVVRDQRVQPITDDKLLADWNGLMIGALARAARALGDATLLHMAESAYDGVTQALGRPNDLMHTYDVTAMLDDHAAMGWAAVELYQTTGRDTYLFDASVHADLIRERFADTDGSLYTVARDTADVIVRQKQGYDSAYPCGNSMAAWLFASVGAIRHVAWMRDAAENCVRSWGAHVQKMSPGFCMLLCTWDMLVNGSQEIVLNGGGHDDFLRQAANVIGSAFVPDAVIVHPGSDLLEAAAYPLDTAPVPSVLWCTDSVCQRPLTTIDDVRMHVDTMRWKRVVS